jgi:hypothetical protein
MHPLQYDAHALLPLAAETAAAVAAAVAAAAADAPKTE